MSEDDVRTLLLADPRVAGRVIQGLRRRLAEVEQRLAETVLKTAPHRLAAVLLRLVAAAPGSTGLFARRGEEVRLTQEQLSELVGTTRGTTTKLLGEFRDAGLLQLRRGAVVVVDREGLRRAAEQGC